MTTSATGGRLAVLGLGWLAGVAAQLSQVRLDAPWTYIAAVAGGVAGLLVCMTMTRRERPDSGPHATALVTLLIAAGAACAGFGAAGWRATARLADALPVALEGVDLRVAGVVAGLPQVGPNGLRFAFEVERATLDGVPAPLPRRVSLGWTSGFHEDAALTQPQRELRAGQRWRFTLRLRRPHASMNPHDRDAELALFEQGVRAVGYVRDGRGAADGAPAFLEDTPAWRIDRWRQDVRDAIRRAVADARSAGVLAALVVGDQGAIGRDDWELFRNTGVAHLMSISGLHVTMFAWLAGLVIGAAWRRSPRAVLWWPTPHAARWGGLAAACAYAAFSGWGVPAQRTLWMLATVALLASCGRRWPWLLVLLAAAAVVTLLDPWALLQPGFWLSFTAVGILLAAVPANDDAPPSAPRAAGVPASASMSRMLASGAARRVWSEVRGGLRTQAIATVGLTPLTLVFFQQVSLVGFAANLLAIPLVTLLITPLAMLGVLATPFWTLAARAVDGLIAVLGWLAAWPHAVWTVPAAPWWAQAAGLVAGVLLVLPLPWRVRLAALPLVAPLLFPATGAPPEGGYALLAVDVGQGTSVLVRTRRHLLVYDAGPQYSRDSDAGGRVLLPLLRARGEAAVDMLMLSHRDLDHVGGASALLHGVPVREMLTSLEPGHPLLAQGVPGRRCEAGQRWDWDGVRFEVLHPGAESFRPGAKSNALSCVLRIAGQLAGRPATALLTGDIERAEEAALLARHGDALAADVLIVPHHGSRTSSSAAFLDAVRPRVAVVQAGWRNRFGHPAPDVLERYHERGIAVRRSGDCGAWHAEAEPAIMATPTTATPARPADSPCERDRRRRYWHHPGAGEPTLATGAAAALARR